MADVPNYHISLWPDPPGSPATYLCLLCTLTGCTEAEILAHVPSVHTVNAVPTPLAANPPPVIVTSQKETPDARSPDVLPQQGG